MKRIAFVQALFVIVIITASTMTNNPNIKAQGVLEHDGEVTFKLTCTSFSYEVKGTKYAYVFALVERWISKDSPFAGTAGIGKIVKTVNGYAKDTIVFQKINPNQGLQLFIRYGNTIRDGNALVDVAGWSLITTCGSVAGENANNQPTNTQLKPGQKVCPNAPLSYMTGVTQGRSTLGGDPLRVRNAPGGKFIGYLENGETFTVIGNAACANNAVWWHIHNSRIDGWVMEGSKDSQYIEPIPSNSESPEPVSPVSLPSSNGLISFLSPNSSITVADAKGNRVFSYTVPVFEDCSARPQFSPDRKYLAFEGLVNQAGTYFNPVSIIDLSTGKTKTVIKDINKHFDWSPDGKRIAYDRRIQVGNSVSGEGLWVVDVDSGKEQLFIPMIGGSPLTSPQWSPDGKRIAYRKFIMEGYGPFVTNSVDGKNPVEWTTKVGEFDWSPDGQQIVFSPPPTGYGPASAPRPLLIANVDGSNQRILVNNSRIAAFQPRWSPDGKLIEGGA